MSYFGFSLPDPIASRRSWPWPTFLLCAVGVIVPNLLPAGALAFDIGIPPRTLFILGYAALAVLVTLNAPVRLAVPLVLLLATYDGLSSVAYSFNLAPIDLLRAIPLVTEIELSKSNLYIAMLAMMACVLMLHSFLILKLRTARASGNIRALLALTFVVATADLVANASPHYHFGLLACVGKPMESAARASGFRQAVLSTNRGSLLVIVEALGVFSKLENQKILEAPFNDARLLKDYTVTTGETTYYGSTTAAEMRELCDTREPYDQLTPEHRRDCLPMQLAAKGRETLAVHNFTGRFFDRNDWYPEIGFQQRIFLEDWEHLNLRSCGGSFRGPCDAELIPELGRLMQQSKRPSFTYWMTLGTHVPIRLHEGTPRLGCKSGGPMQNVEVCSMTEMWLDVLHGIADLAVARPKSEILIVGDHAPPLWSRAGRNLFVPGKVPWIRLTPRA